MPKLTVHRHVKTSVVIAIAVSLILVVAYFLLEYRTGQVVKLIVDRQSNGRYQLELDDVDFSFLNHKIEVTKAVITSMDSGTMKVRSTFEVPRLYLKLQSWSSLIFHKKLSIDSLYLLSPSFETSIDSGAANTAISFQTAEIFRGLDSAVALLHVRSLHLQDGSLKLNLPPPANPFEIHHIDFTIRNLGEDKSNSNRFLSADDIELTIPEQHWKFEDNLDVNFKKLHFSGRHQSFQIDSCEIITDKKTSRSNVHLAIDKIYFNSDSLKSFFETGALHIDTLLCVHPFVQVQLNNNHLPAGTTAAGISESLKNLFPDIHVKHLTIVDGQFTAESGREGKSFNYATKETDLQIGNLSFHPNQAHFLSVGDLGLQLKQITFYTPDSLYQLKMEEFDLYNDEVQFKKSFFGPTEKNGRPQSFFAVIPVLALHRLNLEDLLEKRLGAEMAEMISPTITIESGVKAKRKPNENFSGFYAALNGLSQLLRVPTLNVRNATVNFHSSASDSLTMTMHDFSSSIALNNFLKSGSLLGIKHSILALAAGQIDIHSKTLNATLEDFHLHDAERHNNIHHVQLQASNGATLEIEDLFWHHLDYDSLLTKRLILADSVHFGKLSVDAAQMKSDAQAGQKELPVVAIKMVAADKFNLHYTMKNGGELTAKGKDYLLSGVATSAKALHWNTASGEFTNLNYSADKVTASIDKLNLESPGESKFKDAKVQFTNSSIIMRAKIPEAIVRTSINSSDLSNLHFDALEVDRPQLNFTLSKTKHQKSESVIIPFDITATLLAINKGNMNVELLNGDDTAHLTSTLDLKMDSLRLSKNNNSWMNFDNLAAGISDLTFIQQKVNAQIASADLNLTDGKVSNDSGNAMIQTQMSGQWNNANIKMKLKKESRLNLSNLSGELEPFVLDWNSTDKNLWTEWLNRVQLSEGKILFRDSANSVSVNNTSWNPESSTLLLDSFSLRPNVSSQQHFGMTIWQSDYILFNAAQVELYGFDADRWIHDSIFTIHKLNLENANVDVSRDKRIPFQHGKEKMMPTQLINSIRTHFNIDSLTIHNSQVVYREYSNLTNRVGIVPIDNINATLKRITNVHEGKTDTLALKGKAQLLSSHISKFSYKEAYDDSLSSFSLTVKMSPSELPEFSKITNPLAAIDINSGHFDTILARISGNRYASVGVMQFNYRDLKINLLNREDTLTKRLSLSFVNFVANSFVIKSQNKKPSSVFFLRDRERFVFNYWSKSIVSGVLTSAGIKRNGKYKKQYQKMKQQYNLPPANL